MFVVAGPPGGGKSSVFSRSVSGIAGVFNADDRAAELNGGSYRGIPQDIRAAANREFEQFIDSHIRDHQDFAFETTLRTPVTLGTRQSRAPAPVATPRHPKRFARYTTRQ